MPLLFINLNFIILLHVVSYAVYLLRMQGMLIQLAAATAANGT